MSQWGHIPHRGRGHNPVSFRPRPEATKSRGTEDHSTHEAEVTTHDNAKKLKLYLVELATPSLQSFCHLRLRNKNRFSVSFTVAR